MDDNDKLLGCIGVIVSVLIMIVVGSFLNGWALSILWKWFVVSTFELPALTVMQALGVGLVVSYFTQDLQRQETKTDKKKSITESLLTAVLKVVIKPLVFLAIGWIYLQFM